MSISCANCASVAPAGSPYQRCAGCKQAFYCSKDCQKTHWKQHKAFCRQEQQQDQQQTSAPSYTTGDSTEFTENLRGFFKDPKVFIDDEEDNDVDDDEDFNIDRRNYDDDDDDFDDEAPRPLAFLRTRPFPDLDLSIDGFPVAIVDTEAYVEETVKKDLTAAIATATILWNWHPNALRAFLDCQKYSAFEFATWDSAPGAERYVTHMISRHDRAILIGHYDQDIDWGFKVSYGLLEDGRWKPLWGSTNVLPGKDTPEWVNKIGNMWAKDELYFKPWLPRKNRQQVLTLGGGKVDPATLYITEDYDPDSIASASQRPLCFLHTDPFPGLNLFIDGSPVAIVDTSRSVYNDETNKKSLSGAMAIATVLWSWHPNALRAFLDCERYSRFQFIINEDLPRLGKSSMYLIDRDNREVDFGIVHYDTGHYDKDTDWHHVCTYQIPEKGRWEPTYASNGSVESEEPLWVHSMSGVWARCQMKNARWKPAWNRFITMRLDNVEVDPATPY
ncbi:hypothetical protein KCU95_g4420, partial [Aureobasidium melanogenum]